MLVLSPVIEFTKEPTKPSSETNILIIEQITTKETKWGKYVTVFTVDANLEKRSSLINNANIMEAGKANINDEMLIVSVLINRFLKLTLVKKFAKCSNPTQGLPRMPSPGLKSLKAITAPYIGQ